MGQIAIPFNCCGVTNSCIQTICPSSPYIPAVLYVTISCVNPNWPCLDGSVTPLIYDPHSKYNPGLGAWSGNVVYPGGHVGGPLGGDIVYPTYGTLALILYPTCFGSTGGFIFTGTIDCGVCIFDTQFAHVQGLAFTCSPFFYSAVFTWEEDVDGFGCCCNWCAQPDHFQDPVNGCPYPSPTINVTLTQ